MPRILFIAAHRPDRSPSQRYRFEQFTPYWEANGFQCDHAWIIDEEDDIHFYRSGALWAKSRIFLKSHKRRREHVQKAGAYDLIFVQREAFMTHSTRFERELAATGVPMIYDFDDAIWLMDVSKANRMLRWLKDPSKTAKIVPLATVVIAGNEFLADYARQFHNNVVVMPTVIDTARYLPTSQPIVTGRPIVIGWSGSLTSMPHLEQAIPVLQRFQQQYNEQVSFRIISDTVLEVPGLRIENRKWSSATEAEDLADIDIGIMPLPQNDWSRGKCGFKGLQYMAMARAVVLEDIGVNGTIVQHGVNGLLAKDPAHWHECLCRLVEEPDLRTRLGSAARETVEARYSMIAWRDRYLQLFNELIEQRKK